MLMQDTLTVACSWNECQNVLTCISLHMFVFLELSITAVFFPSLMLCVIIWMYLGSRGYRASLSCDYVYSPLAACDFLFSLAFTSLINKQTNFYLYKLHVATLYATHLYNLYQPEGAEEQCGFPSADRHHAK